MRTIFLCALLSLASLLSGCGFTGEPLFSGIRVPDVAPFSDLGPITFCDGNLRIGLPASMPAGFCEDAAPALRACATDGDCRSRERCTCGGCQVALCDTGVECAASDVCTFASHRCDRSCATDGDCATGEFCPPGQNVCRARCNSDGDCQSGEACESGICDVTIATTGPASGSACAQNSDCQDHPSCVLQRVPGDLREPSPLLAGDGSIVVYVERRVTTSGIAASTIWRAVSPSSLGSMQGLRFRFDPDLPVITPDANDQNFAGAPSVIAFGGGMSAVYANGKGVLRSAHSDGTGLVFTVDAAPVLVPTAPWQMSGLAAPALVPGVASGLLLYYSTIDRTALGLARSDDGTHFTDGVTALATPATFADPVLFRDADAVASPYAERYLDVDGSPAFHLYLAGRGRETENAMQFGMSVAEAANFSILEAGTLDGSTLVPWPANPVFDRVEQFLDHLSELDPALLTLEDGRRFLFYRGAAADESTLGSLGVAVNPPSP